MRMLLWQPMFHFILALNTAKMKQNTFTNVKYNVKLERGSMHNVMTALLNIGGALCSMPQSLADAHY